MTVERMAAAGEEVKLLGVWESSFVLRVGIALHLKGVGYELLKEDASNKSELLLKSNPVYKKIPVLIHNGKPICESMIIVEYIDEVWARAGPSILPPHPHDRAAARFWAAYVDDKLPSAIRILIGVLEENKEQAIEQIITTVQLLEDAFKKCSKEKSFFGGETIGYIDIAFGSCLAWLKAIEKMFGIKIIDGEKNFSSPCIMATTRDEVKLLGTWYSPFVVRVRIALDIKGVGYKFLEEERGTKSKLLLESNPIHKKIPVLIHNGKPICESMIIVEYIDEVWAGVGPSILPTDPYDRAIARFCAAYIDDKIPNLLRKIAGAVEGDKAEAVKEIITVLHQLEDAFKKCGKGTNFSRYLDIALGGYFRWLEVMEKKLDVKFLDEEKAPVLAEWAKRLCLDGTVAKVMPEVEKLVEITKVNEVAK
ncbi:Glutathione S-transferase U17 [Cocos nucifera]|uniref:glutathione transferase n=1 Tax=Cocos nucifera TaxID=13894 RepID=A0A8K0IFI0_COCNU|nr:Glutathione S-transferase U17 [Cocos nucifera]